MTQEENDRLERALQLGRWLVNSLAGSREELQKRHKGPVLDTQELGREYEVKGFRAPFVIVKRRSDGKVGSLMFQHEPRFYFGWEEYDGPPLSTLQGDDNDLPDEPAEKEKGPPDERHVNQPTQQDQPVDMPVVRPPAADQGTEGGKQGT